jgi:uncharacterized protein YbjQ (UPF0145 family)
VGEELPAAAEVRGAGVRASGTWGSALTSGEFAAIRSVGFEPVGQVFGAAVFGIAHGDGYSCPRIMASSREAVEARPSEQLAQRDGLGPLSPLVRAMDQARHSAIERMTAQCAELGGDGVVGLRVTRGSFLLGGQEFTALGTAVRAHGAEFTTLGGAVGARGTESNALADAARAHGAEATALGTEVRDPVMAHGMPHDPPRGQAVPFTSDLSGQDFAKLIMAGWVPAGLVFGVAIGACHDDWQTTRQTRRWSGNREVAGWTDVVNQARRDAGHELEADVQRLGAEGAVVASMPLRVSVRDCPAQVGRRDHIVEASILGTAVVRFARADHGPRTDRGRPHPLAVLPLVPQRRQGPEPSGTS